MELSRGRIEDCRADLLVCGIDQKARLDGGAAGALLQAAGPEMLDSLRLALAEGSRLPGEVVVLQPFKLAAQGIKRLAMVVTLPAPSLAQLQEAVARCLHFARSSGFQSVALPALGCGAAGLKTELAAPILLEALKTGGGGLDLTLVLPRDSDYQIFQRLLKR